MQDFSCPFVFGLKQDLQSFNAVATLSLLIIFISIKAGQPVGCADK